jgi:hypothetical protein
METRTLEVERIDGDKYWERPFDAEESIKRVRQLEGRGTEFKVKSGFELYRAKLNLEHGDWYRFLYRARIEPSKAQRRMKEAKEFMTWAGVFREEDEKVVEKHVVKAMELVAVKSCILQDFASKRRLNLNEFQDKGYHPPGIKHHILGVSLKELRTLLDRIEKAIDHDYPDWTAIERDEVKQTLVLFADQILELKNRIEELEQLSPKEQLGKIRYHIVKRRYDDGQLSFDEVLPVDRKKVTLADLQLEEV